MRLWNEYEGTTIAGSFPVERLIRPEGRSAFFETHNGSGQPAVLRLIEAHFDESEILERWQRVTDLQQPNLLLLKKFGGTELDGTPLVYAVLEASDGDLAAVLRDRPLSPEETRQVATSLVPALQALHAASLVHEHIEPANILAVGETVKLRSDCVRQAPAGPEGQDREGQELRQRDVQAFASLLLECLTRQRTFSQLGNTSLPAPFNQIIRNGLSGTWGLQQISDALAISAAPAPSKSAPSMSAPSKPAPSQPASAVPPIAKPASSPSGASLPHAASSQPHSPSAEETASPEPGSAATLLHSASRDRIQVPVESMPITASQLLRRKSVWIVAAAVVLIILVIFARSAFHSGQPSHVSTLADSTPPAGASHTPTANPIATTAPATSTVPADSPMASDAPWRVIAFTYNSRELAEKRAASLTQRYPALHPEVFTPTGRAPYLVAIGGHMSRDQAESLKRRARSTGLPRDTYIQNFSNRRR